MFFFVAILSDGLCVAAYFVISEDEPKKGSPDFNITPPQLLVHRKNRAVHVWYYRLLYYLIESTSTASIPSSSSGWGSMKTLMPFLTGVASLLGLCCLESKEEDRHRRVISLQPLKSRWFSSSILILLFLTATSNIFFFFPALTFQNVMDFSPMTSAYSFIDHGVSLAIGLWTLSKLSKSTTTTVISRKVVTTLGWICILSSSILLAQITPSSRVLASGSTRIIASLSRSRASLGILPTER